MYAIYAATEGHSRKSIAIVTSSVRYLDDFLSRYGASTDVRFITYLEIRAFILYLREKRCFEDHPFTPPQPRGLSTHTINTYLRSIRAFFSWLLFDEIIDKNPFDKVRVPPTPKKVMATFNDSQIRGLLDAIDTTTARGYRDYTMILMLLDTGLRVSELTSLRIPDVSIEEGLAKVLGKGNKERIVPIGRQVRRHLWRYISRYRPDPDMPRCDLVFLTWDGKQLTKDRMDKIMKGYGIKAGINGVRCSPHSLRHTAAVSFLRNGGDVFSLQKMLGHASLEMTRHYCELADVDVKRAHTTASPVDNLGLRLNSKPKQTRREVKPR